MDTLQWTLDFQLKFFDENADMEQDNLAKGASMEDVLFPDTTIQRSQPKLLRRSRLRTRRRICKRARCPSCGSLSPKHSTNRRQLRDLGLHQPVVLEVIQSVHYCKPCDRYFKLCIDDLAEPGSLFTRAVKQKALASVFQDSLPIEAVVLRMLRDFNVHVPRSTLYYWMSEAGGKSPTR